MNQRWLQLARLQYPASYMRWLCFLQSKKLKQYSAVIFLPYHPMHCIISTSEFTSSPNREDGVKSCITGGTAFLSVTRFEGISSFTFCNSNYQMAKHSMYTSFNGSVRERCGLSHSYIQYLDFILYQGQLRGYSTIKQDGKLLPCSKGLRIIFSVKVRIFNRLEHRNLRVFPGHPMIVVCLWLLVRKQKNK